MCCVERVISRYGIRDVVEGGGVVGQYVCMYVVRGIWRWFCYLLHSETEKGVAPVDGCFVIVGDSVTEHNDVMTMTEKMTCARMRGEMQLYLILFLLAGSSFFSC